MNKKSWIAIGAIIAILAITTVVVYYYIQISPSLPTVIRHVFKVKEIYPTKPGGREWFINMDNPTGDGIFLVLL
jgi:hypothetical protein